MRLRSFWPGGKLLLGSRVQRSRVQRSRGQRRRALVALLLIVNQLVMASGVPLPAAAATPKKDLSKPFPCMYMPCGCMNADQCWHSCCCFTMREKLAWAEENGVEPPAFVREAAALEALADGQTSANHSEHQSEHRSEHHSGCCCCCCKQHAADACSAASDGPQNCGKAACGSAACGKQPDRQSDPQPAEAPATPDGKSVVIFMAMRCQGHDAFNILAQALPAIVSPMRQHDFLPLAEVCIFERSFSSIAFSPAVPPPESRVSACI